MTDRHSDLDARVRGARREFDASFAAPQLEVAEEAEDLLAIRVGEAPFAVRLAELAALRAYRAPTPLPGGPPGLLGLGADGGQLFAVYDLAAPLGQSAGGQLRWLAIPRADARLALAFAGLEGLVKVPSSALLARPGQPIVRALIAPRAEGERGRPVVDLAGVVGALHERAR